MRPLQEATYAGHMPTKPFVPHRNQYNPPQPCRHSYNSLMRSGSLQIPSSRWHHQQEAGVGSCGGMQQTVAHQLD